MDHSWAGDWHSHVRCNFSILVDDREVDCTAIAFHSFDGVTEGHKLSGLSINFGMSRDVVSKLAVKVVEADTFDIEVGLRFVDLDVERVVSFKHGVGFLLMVSESCVGSSTLKSFTAVDISNSFLYLLHDSL